MSLEEQDECQRIWIRVEEMQERFEDMEKEVYLKEAECIKLEQEDAEIVRHISEYEEKINTLKTFDYIYSFLMQRNIATAKIHPSCDFFGGTVAKENFLNVLDRELDIYHEEIKASLCSEIIQQDSKTLQDQQHLLTFLDPLPSRINALKSALKQTKLINSTYKERINSIEAEIALETLLGDEMDEILEEILQL